jgi:hypothetical protein
LDRRITTLPAQQNRDSSAVVVIRSDPKGTGSPAASFLYGGIAMTKETPKDDPRDQTDQGSLAQTDKPWKGVPEKEQRSGTKKSDPDQWQETNTH